MRDREWSKHAQVHSDELDREPRRPGEHEIAPQHGSIRKPVAPPPDKRPGDHAERERLIELRGVHRHVGRRQSLRKSDGPWQIAWTAVIVADQEAAYPPH